MGSSVFQQRNASYYFHVRCQLDITAIGQFCYILSGHIFTPQYIFNTPNNFRHLTRLFLQFFLSSNWRVFSQIVKIQHHEYPHSWEYHHFIKGAVLQLLVSSHPASLEVSLLPRSNLFLALLILLHVIFFQFSECTCFVKALRKGSKLHIWAFEAQHHKSAHIYGTLKLEAFKLLKCVFSCTHCTRTIFKKVLTASL